MSIGMKMCCVCVYGRFMFFFFFQAEDGIRDLTVTGVQTCALPICSQPRSPTYEMREASTRWVPISIVRQVPNLNPSLETSSDVVLARMSRARGPHSPIVVIDEVMSASSAPATSWSRDHFPSDIPAAPPVTTLQWSSPSRMIVRSDLNPPFGLNTGV